MSWQLARSGVTRAAGSLPLGRWAAEQLTMKGTTRQMLIGLVYVGFAVFALALGHYLSREIREKRAWPTVSGKLLERGLGPKMRTQGPGLYLPHVKYSYVLNGTEYIGDQCHLIRGTGGLDDQVRKLVDSLPDPVPVHYNPAEPQQSYLLANSMSVYWLVTGMGVLALVLGLMQLLTGAMKP